MNEQEKIAYFHHLHYEVIMMRWAFRTIPTLEPSNERNATIECFAVHARALYDFLVSKRDKGSRNVVATDYFEGFKAQGTNDISRKITKLNQQIFHTGTTRSADPKLKFNTDDGSEVLEWANATLAEFAKCLPPTCPKDWLPDPPPADETSKRP